MTVSETYLVLFSAIGAADWLFFVWLSVTILLNSGLLYFSTQITAKLNACLFWLYLLFAVFIVGRWGIIVQQVTKFLDVLREAGEDLPVASVSILFGSMGVVFVLASTVLTLMHIRSRQSKVRVI